MQGHCSLTLINFLREILTFNLVFMAGFRDKITPFTLGLSIGLLAACLFFIFKLDTYIQKIDISALTSKEKVSEQVVEPKNENIPVQIKEPLHKKQEVAQEKKTSPLVSMDNVTDSAYTS